MMNPDIGRDHLIDAKLHAGKAQWLANRMREAAPNDSTANNAQQLHDKAAAAHDHLGQALMGENRAYAASSALRSAAFYASLLSPTRDGVGDDAHRAMEQVALAGIALAMGLSNAVQMGRDDPEIPSATGGA